LGYLRVGRHQKVYLFRAPQEAQSWYGSLSPSQYSYVALFAPNNLGTPYAENFGSTTAVSGTAIGAAIADVRRYAHDLATRKAGQAVGVVHTADGLWHVLGFRSSDAADDWFGSAIAEPASFTYAAYFSKDVSGIPYLENEQLGGARVPSMPGLAIPRGIGEARA
jgi:hypothetical protein